LLRHPLSKPLITACDLALSFGELSVLNDISLEINTNEVVTLIGPNGAGKSSLVKLLLGLIKPTRGTISRAKNLTIGYVPQRFDVDPSMPMSVRYLLNLATDNEHECIQAANRMGVGSILDRPLHRLSGGEKQRVLMARALLKQPNLLVLDEPAQGVDVTGQSELYQLINQVKDDMNCSVLVVSHDLHLVMASTDRVICLNHHICCQGLVTDVQNDPAYVDLLGKRGAAAMALYQHHHDHHHSVDGGICNDGGCSGDH